MRRSPLARRTPLRSRRALQARKVPARRPVSAVPIDTRAVLAARSGGRCEASLTGCARLATDVHHRITRKAGGRRDRAHDRLSNLLHACRVCHAWITARPAEAYEVGLSLREWQDPAREPVQTRHDPLPVWLDDDGTWHRYEEVGA